MRVDMTLSSSTLPIKEAKAITGGGLTYNSKMPGPTYNITCCHPMGKCSWCYGKKGKFGCPSTRAALQRRFDSISHPDWTYAIGFLIWKSKCKWFRWHAMGEVVDMTHLSHIFTLAQLLPKVNFWLPTYRIDLLEQLPRHYSPSGSLAPTNLTIRASRPLGANPYTMNWLYPREGVVSRRQGEYDGFYCPATWTDKHSCDDHHCRACWDRGIPLIVYKLH